MDRKILYYLTYMWNLKKPKPNKTRTPDSYKKRADWWLPEAEGGKRENWRIWSKGPYIQL